MIQDRFDVLLVGAGAAAASTAMRVMQFKSRPLSIAMVERFPQRGHGGLAYGGPGTTWHDVFNIQAGRMSIFREDVDDFPRWANDEADRRGWPLDWAQTTFTVSGPAPRRIYRDYLADRLNQALEGLIGADGAGAVTHGAELAQQGVPEADRQAFIDLLEPAAAAMVFWLTARTRTARQQAGRQLDALQGALEEKLTGLDVSDPQKARAVRACLLLEAVQRMTGVSVTPRELRQRLGLAEQDQPARAAAGGD